MNPAATPCWRPTRTRATDSERHPDAPPGLHWERLDVDISLPGLLADLLGMKHWAAKWLGAASIPAKARAARINGRKGGRPRKRPARPATKDDEGG